MQYRDSAADPADPADPPARAAIVVFDSWAAPSPIAKRTVLVAKVEPYTSGSFYLRELPCILEALGVLPSLPEIVIVDGHAWLGANVAGLGARLLAVEPRLRTVVGVAKTRFRHSPAVEVLRGASKVPLFVDEAGDPIDAPLCVAAMHGRFRIPTMLRLVDRLCRGLEAP